MAMPLPAHHLAGHPSELLIHKLDRSVGLQIAQSLFLIRASPVAVMRRAAIGHETRVTNDGSNHKRAEELPSGSRWASLRNFTQSQSLMFRVAEGRNLWPIKQTRPRAAPTPAPRRAGWGPTNLRGQARDRGPPPVELFPLGPLLVQEPVPLQPLGELGPGYASKDVTELNETNNTFRVPRQTP